METKRKPGHCPKGHNCEVTGTINGLFISCDICGWLDDSTLGDITTAESFKPVRYISVDTETTHYLTDQAKIIEIGAVTEDQETFEAVCNPGFENEEDLQPFSEALAINGISPQEILEARPEEIIAQEFRVWLDNQSKRGPVVLIGYNSTRYDSVLLDRPPWYINRRLWDFDIMEMAKYPMYRAGALPKRFGSIKWPKLTEAEQFFGVARTGNTHRALSDATVTLEIFKRIGTKQFGSVQPKNQNQGVRI
jgi:DNA polymerase III epsilon subunit-like protein